MRPGASLCQTQLFPAGSTKHPLQDRAEPISQVCSASGNTFRKGKKSETKSSVMGVKNGETIMKILRSVKGAEEGVSRHQRRDSSADSTGEHSEEGCPTSTHGEVYWSRYPRCDYWTTLCQNTWTFPVNTSYKQGKKV